MFNKKIYSVLFLITCLSFNTFSQTKKDSIEKKDTSDNILDIHLLAGFTNGIRGGLRYYFLKKYSVEFSCGFDPWMLEGVEGGAIYEIGFNIYPLKNYSLICGIMGTYRYIPIIANNPSDKTYTISPYFGVLAPKNKGFMFHGRTGLDFKINTSGVNRKFYLMVALEIGIAIDLF